MYDIRILIAEDEDNLREMLAKYIRRQGYIPLVARDGKEALIMAEDEEYDMAILDVMMPFVDGFQVCSAIRRRDPSIPVIMLTARSATEDKIQGFDSGADQYVPKPFSMKELMARIRSILKKRHRVNTDEPVQYGALWMDAAARRVCVVDVDVDLTPREYDLLLYLTNNESQALSRLMILERVWGYDYVCDERAVDTFVQRLRRKLGVAGEYIQTVRSMGYRFQVGKTKDNK